MLRARILRRRKRRDPFLGLEVRSTTSALGDYRIHSLEFGTHPQAVVLVHGLAGSVRWWSQNVRSLCAHFRVIIPDLIGFGQTQRVGSLPTIPEAAEVLCSWMHELKIVPAHLIGHSMGGQIAVHVAAQLPVTIERLVLVDAAGIPRRLNVREVARSAMQMAPPRAWGDPRFLRTIAADAWVAGPRTLFEATRAILQDDVRPLLPEISVPTLVIWGERDRLIPQEHAEVFRDCIPGARLVVLQRAAHNPMVDRPGAFNRVVTRFLCGDIVGR
jgi:pimeloyl-ACP methyl ester carboxylesterase